ncbi:uncharacterized protein TEOVI_000163300 [Trypanosoma equiperdum]|uniref:Uncharacterized protein n=2 Tax=Trypanozoon TaxID=39700 RepID=Q580M9_TRYB2|nr:hypothetical protein, conserved [Trypanosoma brucei brucei TREU927]6HIV_CU Chain CU, bS12m [Trypanosoma brucei brucei]6HIW_CU Chain CU, bS21m [Trypanosoma brucei brucei]6HIY_CU Chain CU, uS21m [Trypanosoma brucei brucei]7PUA_CU Chain CU, bS21m [Trypanosoma brucei brucei]7PUB_CU Chain CU, bS21m [Trypanosoma brucei brucei]AAX79318.1 hypothetical protein, conserved [Trypanosoma brucei]SCU70064.1 hypothetical protein, conserved [Trypanosoma equiperdum]AAZ10446.1 hypothetical protein, conserv
MLHTTRLWLGGYMMYHRKAMGTMKYSKWKGAHGGISHFYGRTPMVEEVRPNEPITLVDRRIMHYVHHSRLRHFQLFRSYQEKSNSTECKLREGEMLRRRWHRRLQKSFIAFMQFKTMKVLEDQARLVNTYGQAAVNAALGDPWNATDNVARERKSAAVRRQVRALPMVNVVPKHVATMKQIHNDRFNYRWRVN